MPLVSLDTILPEANRRGGYALGLVCLSWEDAEAFVAAGEATGTPVILQAGPGARRHMPVAIWGAMFRELGAGASVPVVAHLDHGASLEDCAEALEAGFTSVMFDGSGLPIDENVKITRDVAEIARKMGASTEAEVGFVGYAAGTTSRGTDPAEAALISALDIDALAVSIGNVHLQLGPSAEIDWALVAKLAEVVQQPLVIHGGSGVPDADRTRLAREFRVGKINVGTELRRHYGKSLRGTLTARPELYDRLEMARSVRPAMIKATSEMMRRAWR